MTASPDRTKDPDPLGYQDLPMSVKQAVTPREYAWMGAEARARLLQDLTEPDYEEP